MNFNDLRPDLTPSEFKELDEHAQRLYERLSRLEDQEVKDYLTDQTNILYDIARIGNNSEVGMAMLYNRQAEAIKMFSKLMIDEKTLTLEIRAAAKAMFQYYSESSHFGFYQCDLNTYCNVGRLLGDEDHLVTNEAFEGEP